MEVPLIASLVNNHPEDKQKRIETHEGITRTPEWVSYESLATCSGFSFLAALTLILPLALFLVLLPPVTKGSQRVHFDLSSFFEQMTVNARVKDPKLLSITNVYIIAMATYQSQSFLVTSLTNQGIFLPWKIT